MIDANRRASNLYNNIFSKMLADPYLEPLFIETLAYDLIFIEYEYSE